VTLAPLSQAAEDLVLAAEGLNQPGRVPPGDSGITLGYGYDLAHHTADELETDWGPFLASEQIHRLKGVVGYHGDEARLLSRNVASIEISPESARKVFVLSSVPKYQAMTERVFPGLADWPVDCQGALFSLVYNRGDSLVGDRRSEMRAIAEDITQPWSIAFLIDIAGLLRAMKRLWSAETEPGLIARRENEARLVESCIPPGGMP